MIYVLSDIHGNERRFNSILEQINLQSSDTLYILGDVIDRHPNGIRILQKIMKTPNIKMILGNHEYMMLNALGKPYNSNASNAKRDVFAQAEDMYLWHCNGGKVTHSQFNKLNTVQRSEVIDYLRSLPLNEEVTVNDVKYKLVHAAPVEEYNSQCEFENATEFAVWNRWNPCNTQRDYTLIFGHSTTDHFQDFLPMQPWLGVNCIGIDCGSGYPETTYYRNTGRLACLRLDDGKVFYSSEAA